MRCSGLSESYAYSYLLVHSGENYGIVFLCAMAALTVAPLAAGLAGLIGSRARQSAP